MAWLFQPIALPRYLPAVETMPSRQEVYECCKSYAQSNPQLFPHGFGSMSSAGVPFPLECFPRSAKIISKTVNPPDIINLSWFGVSSRLRDIIERLEPGVHQFQPVEVKLSDGSPAPTQYFAMTVLHKADNQVIFEETVARLNSDGRISVPDFDRQDHIVISPKESKGWHIWNSADFYPLRLISDELKTAIDAAGIKGLRYYRLFESDIV